MLGRAMNRSIYILSALLLILTSCGRSPLDTNEIKKNTSRIINGAALLRLDSTCKNFVDSGLVAGISALIYEKNEEVYYNAYGFADQEAGIPMSRNTIVLIYSMTKPLTGTALMTLYEEGLFRLDDPVSQYAPEFADLEVYTGVDSDGNLQVESLQRPISIRDLTRHTAGFINRAEIPGLSPLLEQLDVRNPSNTLEVMARKLTSIPLWFQPGAQWEYGLCVDMQAYIIERISGKSFDKYLQEHVLDRWACQKRGISCRRATARDWQPLIISAMAIFPVYRMKKPCLLIQNIGHLLPVDLV